MKRVDPPYRLNSVQLRQWRVLLRDIPNPRGLTQQQRWRLASLAQLQAEAATLHERDLAQLARYRRELGLEPWRG